MPVARTTKPVVIARALLRGLSASLLLVAVAGCPRGDVGAPCNHGGVEPPSSKLVTFPALACNDLLCVYADKETPPDGECNPGSNECNERAGTTIQKFECVRKATGDGKCVLSMDYVLERSMCSKKCSSDEDCRDAGPTKRALAAETTCGGKFKCARIQSLGTFCCDKLCVCEDDLGVSSELDEECESGRAVGCCIDEQRNPINPYPEGCG